MEEHSLANVELVQGAVADIFGLQLTDQRTGAVSVWWATADKIAMLHGLIHQTLDLNNIDLDTMAGISPSGLYN